MDKSPRKDMVAIRTQKVELFIRGGQNSLVVPSSYSVDNYSQTMAFGYLITGLRGFDLVGQIIG